MPFCANTHQKQAWTRTWTIIPSGFHSGTRVRQRDGRLTLLLEYQELLGSQRASLSKFMELTLKFLWTLARLATWLDWTRSANSRWMWTFCHAFAVSVLMVGRTPSLWNVQHGLPAQPDNRGRQSYRDTRNRRIPSRKDHCGCS